MWSDTDDDVCFASDMRNVKRATSSWRTWTMWWRTKRSRWVDTAALSESYSCSWRRSTDQSEPRVVTDCSQAATLSLHACMMPPALDEIRTNRWSLSRALRVYRVQRPCWLSDEDNRSLYLMKILLENSPQRVLSLRINTNLSVHVGWCTEMMGWTFWWFH